jgi:hypothetical protein
MNPDVVDARSPRTICDFAKSTGKNEGSHRLNLQRRFWMSVAAVLRTAGANPAGVTNKIKLGHHMVMAGIGRYQRALG